MTTQHHLPGFDAPRPQRGRICRHTVSLFAGAALFAGLALPAAASAAAGSLDTSNAGCTVQNQNHYNAKGDVYITGSGLAPNHALYVRVTDPSTNVLLGDYNQNTLPVSDANGSLACTRLWDIVLTASVPHVPGYDDTSNNGYVYKVAISSDPTFPSTKTDNFQVSTDPTVLIPEASLTASVTASPSLTRTTTWGIDKSITSASSTARVPAGTDATFGYQVDVTHSSVNSAWQVTGEIQITNAATTGDASGVTVDDSLLKDAVTADPNATCTVDTTGFDGTLPATNVVTLPYSCTLTAAPAADAETDHVAIGWTNTDLTTSSTTADANVDWTTPVITDVDPTVNVTDTFPELGPQTVTVTDPSPATFTYDHTFSGDAPGTCTKHENTATYSTGEVVPHQSGSDTATATVCVGANLTVAKTAATSFTRTYAWSINKTADKSLIEQVGGTVSAAFHVNVAETGFSDSAWKVTGTITVTNPNDWEAVTADASDALDAGSNGTCVVTGGPASVPASGTKDFPYECTYPSAPNPTSGTNTATATWDKATAFTTDGSATGTKAYAFGAPTTTVNKTIHVTDAFNGTAAAALAGGTLTAVDATPYTSANLPFAQTVNVPAANCTTFPNVATITETAQTSSASVEVCNRAKTGALTIGYWQNKNGQAIITGQAKTGVCASATWLRGYLPFQDLGATATCATVATYVTNIIKAANASGAAMNAMLKAQMLATALDVYFSDPSLGGNKIAAPKPIGGVGVDLTHICKVNDATLTCGSGYEDTRSVFMATVVPQPPYLTVSQLLAYAATQSSAGGGVWYGQVKTTQELAKDTFDAINNAVIFSP